MNPSAFLVVLSALRWVPTGLVIPVLVLMLGGRGLALNQVGLVMAMYGVVTLLLELPTGGLADTWGRRPVVVISALLQGVGLAMLAFLGSLPAVLIAVALLGVARALSSGPVEAWYVDAMQALGEPDVEPGLAKGQIAEALALGAGAVVGGLLPRLAPGLPDAGSGFIALSIPFAVGAVMALAYASVAGLLLTSDQRSRGSVAATVRSAADSALRQAPLRRVMLVAMALGVLLGGMELLAPNRFAELAGSPTRATAVFGVLTAVAFVASAGGAAMSTRMPGRRALVGALSYLAATLLVLGLAVPLLGGAAIAYVAFYVTIGMQGPVMAGLLHARVSSPIRSTMMSVESLAMQAGGALASLLVGALAAGAGLAAGLGFIAAAGLAATGVLLFDLRRGTRGV